MQHEYVTMQHEYVTARLASVSSMSAAASVSLGARRMASRAAKIVLMTHQCMVLLGTFAIVSALLSLTEVK